MNVRIQAIHFEIADRLNDFVEKKAGRLNRRFPDITDINVNLTLVKPETQQNKEAVVRVTMPGQPEMVATKIADTFEEATDLAIEAIEHQLEKTKGKK